MPYRPLKLDSLEVVALIDTGAMVTTLSTEVFDYCTDLKKNITSMYSVSCDGRGRLINRRPGRTSLSDCTVEEGQLQHLNKCVMLV